MKKLFAFAVIAFSLIGCASYTEGVRANQDNYREYSELQYSQNLAVSKCFENQKPGDSGCQVLAAGTFAMQTLAGRPAEIRVAKSPGEIMEAIASKGLDATVMLYGFKAVGSVLKTVATQAPQVVRPEIVRPEIVESSTTTFVIDAP